MQKAPRVQLFPLLKKEKSRGIHKRKYIKVFFSEKTSIYVALLLLLLIVSRPLLPCRRCCSWHWGCYFWLLRALP